MSLKSVHDMMFWKKASGYASGDDGLDDREQEEEKEERKVTAKVGRMLRGSLWCSYMNEQSPSVSCLLSNSGSWISGPWKVIWPIKATNINSHIMLNLISVSSPLNTLSTYKVKRWASSSCDCGLDLSNIQKELWTILPHTTASAQTSTPDVSAIRCGQVSSRHSTAPLTERGMWSREAAKGPPNYDASLLRCWNQMQTEDIVTSCNCSYGGSVGDAVVLIPPLDGSKCSVQNNIHTFQVQH